MSKLEIISNLDLLEKDYHGDKYKGYLSGSELWEFLDKCPAEAVYGEKKEKESLLTGSAAHSEVLEMHSFDDLYYRGYEPTENCLTSDAAIRTYLKSKGRVGFSNKTGEVLWNAVRECDPNQHCQREQEKILADANEGKELLKFNVYDDIKGMRLQLMQYPNYSMAVTNGLCEHSIVGEMEINGVKVLVKTRPDIIFENSIINYKTTTDAKPDAIIRHSFNYGYFAKEYFNAIAFEAMFGYFPEIKLLAQSKKKPYVCTGVRLTEEQIQIGKEQFEQAFALWQACKEAETYIDHAQGEWIEVDTPDWMIRKTVG